MALNASESLAYVRALAGDDRGDPYDLSDEALQAAITRRDGNLDLAAADVRDQLESRTGSDFGAAWARRTAEIRAQGSAVLDVGVRRYSAAVTGQV